METCELCDSGYRLQHHHLTYVPEKIMLLCYPCHSIIHMLAKIPEEKRAFTIQTMANLIETYSSHWNNGAADYLKSPHKIKYQKEYHKKHQEELRQKNEEYKREYQKRYFQENKEHLNNLHRQWRKVNKEKTSKYNKRAYKKRKLKD